MKHQDAPETRKPCDENPESNVMKTRKHRSASAGRQRSARRSRRVWTPLREHGAVLLRGAAFSAAAFEAATAPFAEYFRVHQDPTRRAYNPADTTQSVTAGEDAIGLHAERAYLPGRPELLFFCCVTPAASGARRRSAMARRSSIA